MQPVLRDAANSVSFDNTGCSHIPPVLWAWVGNRCAPLLFLCLQVGDRLKRLLGFPDGESRWAGQDHGLFLHTCIPVTVWAQNWHSENFPRDSRVIPIQRWKRFQIYCSACQILQTFFIQVLSLIYSYCFSVSRSIPRKGVLKSLNCCWRFVCFLLCSFLLHLSQSPLLGACMFRIFTSFRRISPFTLNGLSLRSFLILKFCVWYSDSHSSFLSIIVSVVNVFPFFHIVSYI